MRTRHIPVNNDGLADDILLLQRHSETEEYYLKKMETVLKRLNNIGFRANLCKSFFMQQEVEYRGFLLTSDGIKRKPKKIEVMTQIKLGMINFYRDVWKRHSHNLAPLAKLKLKTCKLNWQWGKLNNKPLIRQKKCFASTLC